VQNVLVWVTPHLHLTAKLWHLTLLRVMGSARLNALKVVSDMAL
jgi:hypothetical protein